jgi:predicted GIY-YIG superfamily endonuclease
MTVRTKNEQWTRFAQAMKQILAVPHSEIKEHLDKEREAKKLKRTRKGRYNAFRAVNKSD